MKKIYITIIAVFVHVLFVSAQSVIISPGITQYTSGTVGCPNGYQKINDDLQLLAGTFITNYGNGWMKFDLSVLPSNATIVDAVITYHVTASGNNASTYIKGYSTITGAADDPAVATGSTLYNLCAANIGAWVTTPNTNGAHTISLSATGTGYIQNNFNSMPLFVIAFASSGTSITASTTIAGYNTTSSANKPYLTVAYTTTSLIDEADETTGLKISPNPFANRFTISNLFSSGEIILCDMTGREIYSDRFSSGVKEKTIDISGFAKGIYLVKVRGEKNTVKNFKVVKN
jgi:hypothetical protein